MGCPECERLRDVFAEVINKNRDLLTEYQEAVFNHQTDQIDQLRLALVIIEKERLRARTLLLNHDATHTRTLSASSTAF